MPGLYTFFPQFEQADFVIGKDSFEDVEINETQISNLWYFKNKKKGLIKRFVLQRTTQTEKICKVTLIKKDDGKFTPRFDFEIWNTTKKAFELFSKKELDQNLIKAKVNLDSCHENFLLLINFIKGVSGIDFQSSGYAVIDKDKKDIFENISKEYAVKNFSDKFGKEVTERDISILQNRRAILDDFNKLLTDKHFFEQEKQKLSTKTGKSKGDEDVWQNFFENNPWIFGYGLNYIWCHQVDDQKLEQVVVGTDFAQPGKRIDALLKTAGRLKQFVIVEIKKADTPLMGLEYRPSSWEVAKDLRGGIAQVQKTTSKLREKYFIKHESKDAEGYLTDAIYNFTPKSYLVIGNLKQFLNDQEKLHEEKYASFEMFRNSITNPEIITFDELYERARFIVEHSEK